MLLTFGADAAFGKDTLRVLGDAAAGVSAPIEDVATWFGRMVSSLQAGRPVGEAAARLQELGLLSGTARNELEALAKEGGNTEEAMALLRSEWSKHDGAMQTLSETTEGLESTFGDLVSQMSGAIVEASGLQKAYKDTLKSTNEFMTRTTELTNEMGIFGTLLAFTGTESFYRYISGTEDATKAVEALGDATEELEDTEQFLARIRRERAERAAARIRAEEEEAEALKEAKKAAEEAAKAHAEFFKVLTAGAHEAIPNTTLALDILGNTIVRLNAETGAAANASFWTAYNAGFISDSSQMTTTVLPRVVGGISELPSWAESGLDSAVSFTESLSDGLDIGVTLSRAFEGGGDWLGAAKSLGNQVGGKIGDFIGETLGPKLSQMGGFMSGIFGQALGMALPFIGPLLGFGIEKLWSSLKKPSEAELAARRDVDDYEAAFIDGLSQAQIAEAMNAGWESWEDAAFLIGIRDQYLEIGKSAAQAEADVARYWNAIEAGDMETINSMQAEWDAMGVSIADVAAQAQAAWDAASGAAVSAFRAAESAGQSAYESTMESALEAGATRKEAAAQAAEAEKAAIEEVLAAKGEEYARTAAFDAAMALGANATAEERAEAARNAAQAARESWGAAMDAVVASDQAATEALGQSSEQRAKDAEEGAQAAKDAAVDAVKEESDLIAQERNLAKDEEIRQMEELLTKAAEVQERELEQYVGLQGAKLQAAKDAAAEAAAAWASSQPLDGGDSSPEHRAFGGPVVAGKPYIVGERRPELFVPDSAGTILPSVPAASPRTGSRRVTGTLKLVRGAAHVVLDELDSLAVARS